MNGRVVSVDSRLRWLRACGADDETWTATEDAGEATAAGLRARATAAATWLASRSGSRRVACVVVDVPEAICAWIRSPSAAEPVLAASLRGMTQEWGEAAALGTIESLAAAPEKRASGLGARFGQRANADADEPEPLPPPTASGAAVISVPDALVRLWLDQLDRRGVRIGAVMTLWHAMAIAYRDPDDDRLTAVVLAQADGRLVWSWGGGGELVAAGNVGAFVEARAEEGDEARAVRDGAAKRLWLDWLTWAGQLGRAPEKVHVIGPDADAWAERIAEGWRDAEVSAEVADDPIAMTLHTLRDREATPAITRGAHGLVRLSRRPTRAVRARFRMASLALLCLFVAFTSVAFRLHQKGQAWRGRSADVRTESRALVLGTWPNLANERLGSLTRAARSQYEAALNTGAEFKPPPMPRQILAEYARIAELLASHADPETIRLERLSLDQDRPGELEVRVEQRETGTAIKLELKDPKGWVDWDTGGRGSNPLRPTFKGMWFTTSAERGATR